VVDVVVSVLVVDIEVADVLSTVRASVVVADVGTVIVDADVAAVTAVKITIAVANTKNIMRNKLMNNTVAMRTSIVLEAEVVAAPDAHFVDAVADVDVVAAEVAPARKERRRRATNKVWRKEAAMEIFPNTPMLRTEVLERKRWKSRKWATTTALQIRS